VVQSILTEAGYPAARIASPRLPPRLNLTGTALPGCCVFSAGGLSIGRKKPVNGHVIAKSAFETSKKTLPTASIFTRAWVVPTIGRTTEANPSFGVAAASTYGYVWPPSTERLILTSFVLTGATSVFATDQVTVCVELPG
jgi:hypothetical protein